LNYDLNARTIADQVRLYTHDFASFTHLTTLLYRFLAIVLPTLTFFTHTLLALSFALPGTEQYRAFWSLVFNVVAAGASVLGLIGAVRVRNTVPNNFIWNLVADMTMI
jgi:hypothetical protein